MWYNKERGLRSRNSLCKFREALTLNKVFNFKPHAAVSFKWRGLYVCLSITVRMRHILTNPWPWQLHDNNLSTYTERRKSILNFPPTSAMKCRHAKKLLKKIKQQQWYGNTHWQMWNTCAMTCGAKFNSYVSQTTMENGRKMLWVTNIFIVCGACHRNWRGTTK